MAPGGVAIRQPAREVHRERSHDDQRDAVGNGVVLHRPAVGAGEGHGQPAVAVGDDGHHAEDRNEGQVDAGVATGVREHVAEIRPALAADGGDPPRFRHEKEEHRQQEPRHADGQEGDLPRRQRPDVRQNQAFAGIRPRQHGGTQQRGQGAAHGDGAGIDRDGLAAPFLGEGIRDQRHGARAQGRFADSHRHARDEDLHEVPRESGERGRRRPERHADGDDPGAPATVGQIPERQAHRRVEDRERRPEQETDLEVGEVEIGLDGIDQEPEDVAVDERHDIGDRQQADRVPRPPGGRVLNGGVHVSSSTRPVMW